MKNYYRTIALCLSIALFSACASLKNCPHCSKASVKQDDASLYQLSIAESMSPVPSKVDSNLVAITPNNPALSWKKIDGQDYLLVVTWKQNISYYKPYLDSASYNTGKYPMWVTTSPELNKRIKKEAPKDVNLRLKQLLGLPPTAEYSYFVEFWVKPSDLFRPCPDKEVDDKTCDLCFPADATAEHKAWINENRISRYYPCELYSKYPWSQLGYTYDWNASNTTHIGLSEFVIETNKNIVVKAIYTTEEYLKLDLK